MLGSATNTIYSAESKINYPPIKQLLIEESPMDQVVKYSESVHFNIRASLKGEQGPISYQWMHNFTPMEGETKPTLMIGKVSKRDLGVYTCVVSTVHDKEHDQPEIKASEPVSLMAFNVLGGKIVVDAYLLSVCDFIPEQLDLKAPVQKAGNSPSFPVASESAVRYAFNRLNGPRYDNPPLYFVSGGTNQITIDYYPPAGGSGSGSGTCPPPYRCYFNFRKTSSPYGWLPAAGATTGSARHLQSTQTVVKWFVGTQSSGCGNNGQVNITFSNPNNVYRFTVYCPSSVFATCLTGLQQLELTGFQP
jgi:hypothetical protein